VFHFSNPFLKQIFLQRAPCDVEHCHGGEFSRWAKVETFSLLMYLNLASHP